MGEEQKGDSRRELLRKVLTLGPVAAVAAAIGLHGTAKEASAVDGDFDNLHVVSKWRRQVARTISLDSVQPTQIIITKDPSGKTLVQATYRVKAGTEVIKTVPDRFLASSAPAIPTAPHPADLLSSSELAAATSAWDAVMTALERVELA
ncbi:MAG: hypothetical protein HYX92_01970 [Chloroflexi bacterium]|nr:hypothetical protein [Chloroflexota bacterium]